MFIVGWGKSYTLYISYDYDWIHWYRYESSLELRQRIDQELFVETMRAVVNVNKAIQEYIDYAEFLTHHSRASTYVLIEESIKRFKEIMLEDISTVLK